MHRQKNMSLVSLLLIAFIFSSCSSDIRYQGLINDPKSIDETAKNQFSLITYNIKGIFNKDQNSSEALFKYLNKEKYDFIVFQELFNEETRGYFLTQFDSTFYKTKISRIDTDNFPENIFQDSGLFLLSKYPQISLSHIDFGKDIHHQNGAVFGILKKEFSITLDFIVNKSVLGSLFQLNDSTQLLLFATHLQAIGSETHKQIQLMQIQNFIELSLKKIIKSGIVNPENLLVLLVGDFNTDAYSEEKYSNLLEFLGQPRDLHKEYHQDNKEYSIIFKSFNRQMRFDYIFSYDSISSYTFKKVKIHSINITDVRDKNNQSISDHFALKASLLFD